MIKHKGINGEAEVGGWIEEGITKDAIVYAEEFGKYLAQRNRLSTSQIRNVYGEVKRIEMKGEKNEDFETEVRLLKPKLAYSVARATGREGREATQSFSAVLSAGVDGVFSLSEKNLEKYRQLSNQVERNEVGQEKLSELNQKMRFKNFQNFASFFEAILAYHRAYGGK